MKVKILNTEVNVHISGDNCLILVCDMSNICLFWGQDFISDVCQSNE